MYSLLRSFLSCQSDKCTVFLFKLLFVISYLNCTLWFEMFCSVLYVNYCSVCNWSLGGWVSTLSNKTSNICLKHYNEARSCSEKAVLQILSGYLLS